MTSKRLLSILDYYITLLCYFIVMLTKNNNNEGHCNAKFTVNFYPISVIYNMCVIKYFFYLNGG